MQKDFTIHFIDTETTGLEARRHEIVSFGLVKAKLIIDADNLERWEVLEELELKLQPEHLDVADPIAIKVNKYNLADWQGALSQREGVRKIAELITDLDPNDPKFNRVILAGHNIHFDLLFLHESFSRQGVDNVLSRRALDTYGLALSLLRRDATLKSVSLPRLCEHFGIINAHAHSALSDARASYEVYKHLLKLI